MYLDDLNDLPELAGAAHVAYVRSAVAHGTITSIDTADAAGHARRPRDLHGRRARPASRSPSPFNPTVARTLLASDQVRYVGEPIAAVVAETRAQAIDAAEAVVRRLRRARGARRHRGRPHLTTRIYEAAGSNAVFDSTALGMPDLTGDEYFADCEVTVTGRFINQRVAPVPARGARLRRGLDRRPAQPVDLDAARPGRQGRLSSPATSVEADQVRVITPDVGGGFGAKIGTYPEEIVLGPLSQARSAGRCAGPRPAASR